MNCTSDQLKGNYLYSGRAVGITEPDDLIQLHPRLKTEWESIHRHFQQVGLLHTDQVIWDVSPKMLKSYPSYDLSVFYFGKQINQVKADLAWLKSAAFIRSKNKFISLAEKLNIAVPKTFCFPDKAALANSSIAFPFPCY